PRPAPAEKIRPDPPSSKGGTKEEKAPPPYRPSTGDLAAAFVHLDRSIQYVKGIGPRRAELLRKFAIADVDQPLSPLPFRYEARRNGGRIADVRIGEEAIVRGEIVQVQERIVGRARRRILEGVLRDESGLLGLTWYHQVAYFRNRFRGGQR